MVPRGADCQRSSRPTLTIVDPIRFLNRERITGIMFGSPNGDLGVHKCRYVRCVTKRRSGGAGSSQPAPRLSEVLLLVGCGDVHGDTGAIVHPQRGRVETGRIARLELDGQKPGVLALYGCHERNRWATRDLMTGGTIRGLDPCAARVGSGSNGSRPVRRLCSCCCCHSV